MPDRSNVRPFLDSVKNAAGDFSGLRAGDEIIPLVHPFWSPKEISNALQIKNEWEVSDDLIPFYGDWHDLLCISVSTGKIVMLDDERVQLFVWESGDDFLGCLRQHPEMEKEISRTDKASGVVESESWLDF
jgi:hypothetical protein